MTPVTTRRRSPQRADLRRRQGAGRSAAPLPTLFDAAPGPGGATMRVDAAPGGAAMRVDAAPGGAAMRVDAAPGGARMRVDAAPGGAGARIDAGDRVAEPPMTAGHGETLDRLVVSSWERLVSHADAPCLVCGGTMEPRYGAHAASIGGRCLDCGTTLS
jgi:hypothetical protein